MKTLDNKTKAEKKSFLRNSMEKLSIMDIPKSVLSEALINELDGRETFMDTDKSTDERIYSGDVFEAIGLEISDIRKGKYGVTMMNDYKKLGDEVDMLIEVLAGRTELIRLTTV